MGLRKFERRLEHLVEGTFARVFKSGLTPLEIGRRVAKEIDANQSLGVDGATTVPNHFWVYVSTADHDRFAEVATPLTGELAEAARTHIRDEQYRVLGPVSVSLVEAAKYPEGSFQVQAQWREGPTTPQVAVLLLSNGERVALGVSPFTVGRMSDSSLVLSDANVSRSHAVLRQTNDGWSVADLNSTNGTTVNGQPISDQALDSGDLIVFGSTAVMFEVG